MAKREPTNPFQGRWLIESMTGWDVDHIEAELKPFIEFEGTDSGQFQFACVYGALDCRVTQRDGQAAVEFSWEGSDEGDHVFGRGWAVLDGDELNGMIFFHHGDESGFAAQRAGKKTGA